MPTVRDSQRGRLYRAERATFSGHVRGKPDGTFVENPVETRSFEDVAEVVRYVRRIERSAWFRREFPEVAEYESRIEVRESNRAYRYATGGRGLITLPSRADRRWAHKDYVVLHELAHCLVPPYVYEPVASEEVPTDYEAVAKNLHRLGQSSDWVRTPDGSFLGRRRLQAHGPEFARVYYELVYRWMGRDAAFALGRSFRREKVRKATKAVAGMKG